MTTPIALGLVGAAGRMGLAIARLAPSRGFRVVAAVDASGAEAIGRDLGALCGGAPSGVMVGDDPLLLAESQVVVDLSLPSATAGVAAACAKLGKPLVCGTTGLKESELHALRQATKTIPVLYTPNLSPGIAALTKLVEEAVGLLGPDYDVEIVEIHHRKKVDAPSGTAALLADSAARAMESEGNLVYGRHGGVGPRPDGEIGVHAVRGGTVFGEHTVILSGPDERLELTHRAASRELFAEGALRAARYLATAKPGLYSMRDALS